MTQGKSSGGFFGFIAFVFGLAFVVLPIMFSAYLEGMSQIILMGFGVLLLLVGGIVMIITKLYRKTSANEAFVRTGMGGKKTIISGGSLVIPVVHNVIPVSLETMKLEVHRVADDALITGDNLRVDVVSEFYIKVEPLEEAVVAAATSLGGKSVDAINIKELVEEKFVSALRTVAATMELTALHTQRDKFADSVETIVKKDLKPNGLTLETVTISRLDQTSMSNMNADDNVFDAKGAKKIAEIVENQRVETTRIKTAADQRVKEEEVKRDKFIYQQEVERAEAEAEKNASIEKANSLAEQEAKTFAANQAKLAGVAEVKKEEEIALALVEKEKQLEVANEKREQASLTAQIEKNKAVDIAEQEKQIAVTNKEKEKALADQEKYEAEAEEEKAKQLVLTVEKTEEAKREKEVAVITEQAEAEKTKVRDNMKVDVAAYEIKTQAEAEKEASKNKAEAITVEAVADRDAKIAEAEGLKAKEMIPVNVAAKQVEVDKAKVEVRAADVEVTGKDLEYKSAHAEISKELEIALAEIQAKKEIGMKQAESIGAALANADMQIWGDNKMLNQIQTMFGKGQAASNLVNGFMSQLDDTTSGSMISFVKELLNKAGIKLDKAQEKALENTDLKN